MKQKKERPKLRQYVTVADVAAALAVGPTTVYEMLARKELESLPVGKTGVRIPLDALERWIEANTRGRG